MSVSVSQNHLGMGCRPPLPPGNLWALTGLHVGAAFSLDETPPPATLAQEPRGKDEQAGGSSRPWRKKGGEWPQTEERVWALGWAHGRGRSQCQQAPSTDYASPSPPGPGVTCTPPHSPGACKVKALGR